MEIAFSTRASQRNPAGGDCQQCFADRKLGFVIVWLLAGGMIGSFVWLVR
jgi:hypothetical protein